MGIAVARHFLKHIINHTNMEVHMPVQAGAEPVDDRDCANVQGGPVHMDRTEAVSLQALRNNAQEDAQHHVEHSPVALREVAQSLRDGEYPLAHRKPGET